MGNFLSRFRTSFENDNPFDYQMYEKSVRRNRRITFGFVAAVSGIVGYQLSGSIFISMFCLLLPIIPLSMLKGKLWADLQPEFITDEWRNCVAAIDKTLTRLHLTHTNDDYVFRYPIVLNLPLLYLYHHHQFHNFAFPSDMPVQASNEELHLALHFMRFASAAYGAVFMHFLGLIKELPNLFNSSYTIDYHAIAVHTGVSLNDVVWIELSGEHVVCPRHYIAIDHSHKTVVLVVRGTASLGDVITDLVCDSVEFLGGTAHKGIKEGAEILFQKTFSTVCYLLNEQRGYSLTITGHSLGAGTSILLTLLFLLAQRKTKRSKSVSLPDQLKKLSVENELPASTVIKCYAFAPPPVFSPLEILPKILTDAIQVYTNNCDVVPRLSLATFNELIHMIKKIDKCRLSAHERFKAAILSKDHPSIFDLLKIVKEELTDIDLLWRQDNDHDDFPRLHIPGNIHYFYKPADPFYEDRHLYKAVMVSPFFFSKILLMDGFFADHLPDKYEHALESLCRDL